MKDFEEITTIIQRMDKGNYRHESEIEKNGGFINDLVYNEEGIYALPAKQILHLKLIVIDSKVHLSKLRISLENNVGVYYKLSNSVVILVQNRLVEILNDVLTSEGPSSGIRSGQYVKHTLPSLIRDILELMFITGTITMGQKIKMSYLENLEKIRLLAKELNIDSRSPKEKLENTLKMAYKKLEEIRNTLYFENEFKLAKVEMEKIKERKFLRFQSKLERQIEEQQQKVKILMNKSETEKQIQVNKQKAIISEIQDKIDNA